MSRFVYNKNTKQVTVTAGLTDVDYLVTEVEKAYKSDDTADTTIDSSDYIPFYDSSTNSTKKILVSNAHFGGDSNYKGTKAVWDTLTDEEKAQYDTYDFTDDFNGMPIDSSVVQGSEHPVSGDAVYNYVNTMITSALTASY